MEKPDVIKISFQLGKNITGLKLEKNVVEVMTPKIWFDFYKTALRKLGIKYN